MSAVFNHAIRYEFLPQGMNPITLRQSAKRMRVPDVLDAKEVTKLFSHLSQRDRVMVLLDTTTGLRRSELIGLKWSDVSFEQLGTFGDAIGLPVGRGQVQNRGLQKAGAARSVGGRGVANVERVCSSQSA